MIYNNKKYKWKYWHVITTVSEAYTKFNPEIKKGLGVGRKDKHDRPVDIFNLENGQRYNNAYDLEYLGRLPWDASIEDIKALFKKHGFA